MNGLLLGLHAALVGYPATLLWCQQDRPALQHLLAFFHFKVNSQHALLA